MAYRDIEKKRENARRYQLRNLTSLHGAGWRKGMESAEPFAPVKQANQECRKLTYVEGEMFECGQPTNGHTYCPECAHALVAMFDPPPKQRSAEAA